MWSVDAVSNTPCTELDMLEGEMGDDMSLEAGGATVSSCCVAARTRVSPLYGIQVPNWIPQDPGPPMDQPTGEVLYPVVEGPERLCLQVSMNLACRMRHRVACRRSLRQ